MSRPQKAGKLLKSEGRQEGGYRAPYSKHLALKALLHGSHSLPANYTIPAFIS